MARVWARRFLNQAALCDIQVMIYKRGGKLAGGEFHGQGTTITQAGKKKIAALHHFERGGVAIKIFWGLRSGFSQLAEFRLRDGGEKYDVARHHLISAVNDLWRHGGFGPVRQPYEQASPLLIAQ